MFRFLKLSSGHLFTIHRELFLNVVVNVKRKSLLTQYKK